MYTYVLKKYDCVKLGNSYLNKCNLKVSFFAMYTCQCLKCFWYVAYQVSYMEVNSHVNFFPAEDFYCKSSSGVHF